MPHFKKVATRRAAIRAVAPEWQKLNVEIGRTVNEWSRRKDLTSYIGADGGRGMAAALYDPIAYEIEVNTHAAFGENVNPIFIDDFTLRTTHFEWPKAAGAVLHEAMHAAHTTLLMCKSFETLPPEVDHWFNMLEEPRIESLGVKMYPENRELLRSCALDIVLKDSKETVTKLTRTGAAAQVAVLAMGRVDAGVLEASDIKHIRAAVLKVIPKDVLKKMRRIWREFLTLRGDAQIEQMYQLARDFEKLVREQSEENGEKQPQDGDADAEGMMQDILDAIAGDRVSTEFQSRNAVSQQASKEKAQAAEKQRQQEAADQKRNEEVANQTFRDKGEVHRDHLSRGRPTNGSNSRLVQSRVPSAEERAVAMQIANALKKAKYRDRVTSVSRRAVPPGKLNVGAAMQASAIRKSGNAANVEPWRKKTRKHVEDPNLTVGIMCDISGSMRAAMEPIAVSSWVMSNAVSRVDGTAAAVYFGSDTFAVLNPGERLKNVEVYSAADGVESFDKGFRGLDGGLNLLQGKGARLLVVCSDGRYGGQASRTETEMEACIKWLKACRDHNVAVVWLDYSGAHYAESICNDAGAYYVNVGRDVTAAATEIGKACTESLTKASR